MTTRRPLFALLLWVALSSGASAEPFRFAAGKCDSGELKYVNHVPVLHVHGTPDDIGSAVGALALKPAQRILGYPRELLGITGAGALWNPLLAAGKGMFRRFPDDYSKELDSMARASGSDRDLLIAGNTFFDIKKSFACSAVLIEKQKSATGVPLFARNLDYPSLGYVHRYSLVTAYRPKDKLGFVSVTFPGLVGVVSGMNEAGLCVGVLEVFDVKQGEKHFDATGTPYALCLRPVLEEANSVFEAYQALQKMRRTTCINVAVADESQVAVFEVTPERVVWRKPENGVCASTNHFCSSKLRPEEPLNMDRSFERLATLERLRGTKKTLDVADLYKQLDAVSLGTVTLQSMVFEPAARKLHLSIGCVPASRGVLRTLDVAALLGK